MGEKDQNGETNISSFLPTMPYDRWILVNPSGSHPPARYEHAAEMIGDKLYVIGGSRNGRYLSDIQVFDFRSLKWSVLRLSRETKNLELDGNISDAVFPASAGHSLVKWDNKLLLVAGHSKISSDTVRVWQIDIETNIWSPLYTSGEAPIARGGQSVSLVGSKLFMFGGEDSKRRILNDLHVLDLETLTWELVQTKKAGPAPRFDHTATVHAERYLLIFGGSSYSTCFNDLHLLDLQTMEWSKPETQGEYVNARGGHAGTVIDETWYIVGGGDNKSGATETIILNMSKFVWSVTTTVSDRHSLASEGLSLCSTTLDGEKLIVAFGGYNGKYNNEIFIMKPKPRETARARILQSPAAAAAAASVTAAYAVISASDRKKTEISIVKNHENKIAQSESSAKEFTAEIDLLITEKRGLEARLVDVKAENSKLKDQIEIANNYYNELTKELQSVQGQLSAESSRCVKLESQISVAKQKLEMEGALENELEILRRQISQVERDLTVSQRQKSGGVWQWMAGTPPDSENK